jgi:thioredoxin reductase
VGWGSDENHEVENFPGFPGGIAGPDLMEKMEVQAQVFGTEILREDVAELDVAGQVKLVTLADGSVPSDNIAVVKRIFGTRPKPLLRAELADILSR